MESPSGRFLCRIPEQLTYVMGQHGDGCCSPLSWLDQRDIREQQRAFQSLAAYSYDNNLSPGKTKRGILLAAM